MTTFIRAASIRAARTVAQTAVALIGTATVLHDVDWRAVVSGAVLAGLLSVLTSIAAGLPEADDLDLDLDGPGPPDPDAAGDPEGRPEALDINPATDHEPHENEMDVGDPGPPAPGPPAPRK